MDTFLLEWPAFFSPSQAPAMWKHHQQVAAPLPVSNVPNRGGKGQSCGGKGPFGPARLPRPSAPGARTAIPGDPATAITQVTRFGPVEEELVTAVVASLAIGDGDIPGGYSVETSFPVIGAKPLKTLVKFDTARSAPRSVGPFLAYRTPLPVKPWLMVTRRGRDTKQSPIPLPVPDSFEDRVDFKCPHGCKLRMRATSRDGCLAHVEVRLGSGTPQKFTLAVDFSTFRSCPGCRRYFMINMVDGPDDEGSSAEDYGNQVSVTQDREEKATLMCRKRALERELSELLSDEARRKRERRLEGQVRQAPCSPFPPAPGHFINKYLVEAQPKQPSIPPPAHLLRSNAPVV